MGFLKKLGRGIRKGVKKLGKGVKKVASSSIGRGLVGLIPGVGVPLSMAMAAGDAIRNKNPLGLLGAIPGAGNFIGKGASKLFGSAAGKGISSLFGGSNKGLAGLLKSSQGQGLSGLMQNFAKGGGLKGLIGSQLGFGGMGSPEYGGIPGFGTGMGGLAIPTGGGPGTTPGFGQMMGAAQGGGGGGFLGGLNKALFGQKGLKGALGLDKIGEAYKKGGIFGAIGQGLGGLLGGGGKLLGGGQAGGGGILGQVGGMMPGGLAGLLASTGVLGKKGQELYLGKPGGFERYNIGPNYDTYLQGYRKTADYFSDPERDPVFQRERKNIARRLGLTSQAAKGAMLGEAVTSARERAANIYKGGAEMEQPIIQYRQPGQGLMQALAPYQGYTRGYGGGTTGQGQGQYDYRPS